MAVITSNQPVGAKSFLVEEGGLPQAVPGIKFPVVVRFEALHFDPKLFEQLLCMAAIKIWPGDRLRSAVTDQLFSSTGEFIALGVPPEIVMVLEYQNPRLLTRLLPIKISG